MRTVFKNISSSGVVVSGGCVLDAIKVNTTSSGTLALYDGTTTSGDSLGAASTLAVGVYNMFGVKCTAGIYADIGNTMDVTFLLRANDL